MYDDLGAYPACPEVEGKNTQRIQQCLHGWPWGEESVPKGGSNTGLRHVRSAITPYPTIISRNEPTNHSYIDARCILNSSLSDTSKYGPGVITAIKWLFQQCHEGHIEKVS